MAQWDSLKHVALRMSGYVATASRQPRSVPPSHHNILLALAQECRQLRPCKTRENCGIQEGWRGASRL